MDARSQEFIWKSPYNPAQATEERISQQPSPIRRLTATLPSPKSLPVSAVSPQVQFTFSFPRKSYLPQKHQPYHWPTLNRLLPLVPNMSDPTTISEVGRHDFTSDTLRDPGASSYTPPSFLITSWNQAEKQKMVASLRNHSVNTLAELRRIERIFAAMGTSDVTEPMTTACMYHYLQLHMDACSYTTGQYYVNSHMLLTELRSLTRNYPFRSRFLMESYCYC
jgi:hypothetical protein